MYECKQILHRMQLHSDEVIHVGLYRMSGTTLLSETESVMDRKFTMNEKRQSIKRLNEEPISRPTNLQTSW